MDNKEILESLGGFGDIKVSAKAILGTVRMPVANFLRLTRGSIVALERSKDADLDILINEHKVAEGQIKVTEDETIAIEIIKVTKPKRF